MTTTAHLYSTLPFAVETLNIPSPTKMADDYSFEYFTVRFPADQQYVAHVEINRPERLNAFIEV